MFYFFWNLRPNITAHGVLRELERYMETNQLEVAKEGPSIRKKEGGIDSKQASSVQCCIFGCPQTSRHYYEHYSGASTKTQHFPFIPRKTKRNVQGVFTGVVQVQLLFSGIIKRACLSPRQKSTIYKTELNAKCDKNFFVFKKKTK